MTEKKITATFPHPALTQAPTMIRKTFGGWGFAPETEYIGIVRGGLGCLVLPKDVEKIAQPF